MEFAVGITYLSPLEIVNKNYTSSIMILFSRVSHTNTQWTEHRSTRISSSNIEDKKMDTASVPQISQESEFENDDGMNFCFVTAMKLFSILV